MISFFVKKLEPFSKQSQSEWVNAGRPEVTLNANQCHILKHSFDFLPWFIRKKTRNPENPLRRNRRCLRRRKQRNMKSFDEISITLKIIVIIAPTSTCREKVSLSKKVKRWCFKSKKMKVVACEICVRSQAELKSRKTLAIEGKEA